jgi:CHAD domain-containing protein
MVRKRAVRKQQDTSRPLAQLGLTAEAFNAAVTQCLVDAEADAVHRVRTGSRRLQAMLEAALREGDSAANELQEPAQAWLRQLKRTRRAAGPVRNLDVHRELLERWLGASEPSPLRAQAEALDHWIKGERKRRAHGMQKQIRKRQQPLLERQSAVFAAVDTLCLNPTQNAKPVDAVALEAFVRAADAMPVLDAENLHDFRKATKKARYVAEAGAEGETYSSVARALKRIQDTIGDWHDWLCLAQEARAQDAPELTAALDRAVEQHFSLAMRTTETMRGRLLGEWMAARRP